MYILSIETTGKYGSAAVTDSEGRVHSAASYEEMNHLKGIISVIDDALKSAGVSKHDLTHIAASAGPGSFTGIRIGVTTARTMAQMLGLPCIAVSSLEAMAARVLPAAALEGAGYIASVINARRHQTYAGVYKAAPCSDVQSLSSVICSDIQAQPSAPCSDVSLVPVLEEKQYMIEELLGLLKDCRGSIYFTGDGIDTYEDVIRETLPDGSFSFAPEEIRYQHAGAVAGIALRKAKAGEVCSYEELLPEYMRLAEAEQRLRAGTLSDKIRKPVKI